MFNLSSLVKRSKFDALEIHLCLHPRRIIQENVRDICMYLACGREEYSQLCSIYISVCSLHFAINTIANSLLAILGSG